MGRGARSTCRLTVEQLTEEKPPRASVGAAMRYLAHCSPEERVEAMARVDAAFAEIQASPIAFAGPGIPKARTQLYLKKNFVPAAIVVLDDHRSDRGTMQASTDGSVRRSFWFDTRDMIVEQASDRLMLVGIPRWRRSRINERFKSARLGWAERSDLDGEWADEQRAAWALLCETADLTERIIDKARLPAPRRSTLTGLNPW